MDILAVWRLEQVFSVKFFQTATLKFQSEIADWADGLSAISEPVRTKVLQIERMLRVETWSTNVLSPGDPYDLFSPCHLGVLVSMSPWQSATLTTRLGHFGIVDNQSILNVSADVDATFVNSCGLHYLTMFFCSVFFDNSLLLQFSCLFLVTILNNKFLSQFSYNFLAIVFDKHFWRHSSFFHSISLRTLTEMWGVEPRYLAGSHLSSSSQ